MTSRKGFVIAFAVGLAAILLLYRLTGTRQAVPSSQRLQSPVPSPARGFVPGDLSSTHAEGTFSHLSDEDLEDWIRKYKRQRDEAYENAKDMSDGVSKAFMLREARAFAEQVSRLEAEKRRRRLAY